MVNVTFTLHLAKGFSFGDTELLLFVDNQQPQIFELHIFAGVRCVPSEPYSLSIRHILSL